MRQSTRQHHEWETEGDSLLSSKIVKKTIIARVEDGCIRSIVKLRKGLGAECLLYLELEGHSRLTLPVAS